MIPEHINLAQRLREQAVCETEFPSKAVSVLMTAAASVLNAHFSPEQCIEIMQTGLDATGAELRRRSAN